MADPAGIERRLASIESRLDNVESRLGDVATAARYLAAAHYRDLAELGVKVDANRRAINALGDGTAGRFDQVDQRIGRLENEMRTGFATSVAGDEQIVGLFNHVIARLDDE
jgi:hypothetical protein